MLCFGVFGIAGCWRNDWIAPHSFAGYEEHRRRSHDIKTWGSTVWTDPSLTSISLLQNPPDAILTCKIKLRRIFPFYRCNHQNTFHEGGKFVLTPVHQLTKENMWQGASFNPHPPPFRQTSALWELFWPKYVRFWLWKWIFWQVQCSNIIFRWYHGS